MYPGFEEPGWFGFSGFGIALPEGGNSAGYADGGYTYWTDFLFQAMFAATAATIVSGAVAERIKLTSYLIFTVFFVGLAYPIIGSWRWGGGMLDSWGFHRSEEHTSELQSLMRISYAVLCLKKKK